jgi:hypothetical protein
MAAPMLRRRTRKAALTKAAAIAAGTMDEKMKMISQSELLRPTRAEPTALLHKIPCVCRTCPLAQPSCAYAREPAEHSKDASWPEFRPR